jgi:hypothetical protein
MNAYELADLMLDVTDCESSEYYQAGLMLRQQAEKIKNMEIWEKKYLDRIATLENQLDKCSHHEAMAHQGGYEIGKASQIKELSDEEIMVLYEEYIETQYASESNVLGFGRAILKKASEK